MGKRLDRYNNLKEWGWWSKWSVVKFWFGDVCEAAADSLHDYLLHMKAGVWSNIKGWIGYPLVSLLDKIASKCEP